MAAGVEAAAEVAATESKMEEESGAHGVPSGNGAPGPKGEGERPTQNEKRKEKNIKRGGNRFEPYANPTKRYRAFITNIPFDVKWQTNSTNVATCCTPTSRWRTGSPRGAVWLSLSRQRWLREPAG
uniref:HnRNP M nuclear localisation signal domain-containing protein n=1 Tax=Sciurus vulgaris TaxID=55149 RepID=A0A8D2AXU0_SCIVU